jgi:GxxExxY protein
LESAYHACLCRELTVRGIPFRKQVDLPIEYKGVALDCGYRLDLLIGDAVIVEIKCVERILPVHEAQLLTYLKLAKKHVGLLMNFHVQLLKDGIVRRVI